jgi:hypothetical protein
VRDNKDPLVTIIIVSWNGLLYLKKTLPSIQRIKYNKFETILVDNHSSDGTIDYVSQNFPEVQIVCNQENLGFAEANNIGFRRSRGDLILFCNNDVEVADDFLGKLVDELRKDEKLGGVQPKIVLMNENDKLDSVGGFLTNSGFLFHYGIYKSESDPKYNRRMDIYSAKGACMLFKREVIEKVGLFDKDFFAYFEETDFCHRVWLAGYKIRYIPEAKIYHQMGGTSKDMELAFIQFHSFKNRLNSFLKNLDFKELLKIFLLHLFLINLASVFYVISGKVKVAFSLQRAISWNLVNLKKTLHKRKIIQRDIRKVKDSEIIPLIKKSPKLLYYLYLLLAKVERYKDPAI